MSMNLRVGVGFKPILINVKSEWLSRLSQTMK